MPDASSFALTAAPVAYPSPVSRDKPRRLLDIWQSGDVPWLCDWPISWRFHILVGLAIFAGACFAGAYLLGEKKISMAIAEQASFQIMNELAADVRSDLLIMQAAENSFVDENNRAAATQFSETAAKARESLSRMKALPVAAQSIDRIDQVDEALQKIDGSFGELTRESEKLGLSEDEGLKLKLSSSMKAIQQELDVWPNQDALVARMLQMRLAEKDFIQFKEASLLRRHRRWSNEFDLKIDSGDLDAGTRANFHKLLSVYLADMSDYSQTSLAITSKLSELRERFKATQPVIDSLFSLAREGAQQAAARQELTRRAVLVNTSVIGLLAGMLYLLASVVFQRSITQPVTAMEESMRQLAEGRHGVAIPGVARRDEIGLMAAAVQVFKDNALAVEQLRRDQERQANAYRIRAERLEELARRFDADVDQIVTGVARSATTLEDTANDLASMAELSSQKILMVENSSGQASASVQTMAAASEQLAASVTEIAGRIAESACVTNEAAMLAQRTDHLVNGLSEAAQKIGDVITMIEALARQTNMLALNATIESARAGEAGKGFSVVAKEVKLLASHTTAATRDITVQVQSIQQATKEAVDGIRQVVQTVQHVNAISSAIASSVEEQGAATQEIARNAGLAAQGTETVATSISWSAQQAHRMGGVASQMRVETSSTARQTESLRDAVNGFLTAVRSL
ncbi:MAG TPA: methyl-accepting chemotaxis protein [Rhodospirillaceae bacterium]|nr:methyl-accepting chemotaxis protein [Rhodospirillaceae bacterium]